MDVRRLWPDIVEATKLRRRIAWIHLSQNCQVVGVEGDVLTLGFSNAGARDSFVSSGCGEVVRQAGIDVVGADWRIETIVDPGATPGDAPRVTKPAAAEPVAAETGPVAARPQPGEASRRAREAIRDTTPGGAAEQSRTDRRDPDADVHPDDLDAETNGISGAELLARELGAQVIEEIPHQ